MSDELREIVERLAQAASASPELDTDGERWVDVRADDVLYLTERVKAMLDVIEAARKAVDSAIEPEGYGLTRPLADALAVHDSSAPLREGAGQ